LHQICNFYFLFSKNTLRRAFWLVFTHLL